MGAVTYYADGTIEVQTLTGGNLSKKNIYK